jgi:thiamine-phosphate pyrophosphorylase
VSGRAGSAEAEPPSLARLHVVTDSDVLAGSDFRDRAAALLRAGRGRVALHVRGPATTGRALHEHVVALMPVARASGARLFVNDRVDVALVTDDVGVHLGARSLPVGEARAVIGPGRTVGASVHDAGEAERAASEGANFAFVGNVFATASHPGRAGMGSTELARICASIPGLPVIAIGGVRPEHVPALIAAGAHGVAVLGGVWTRSDVRAALEEYLVALPGC